MKPPRRNASVILVTLVLLGGAFLVRATQPTDDQQEEPFVTTAQFGERAEGRDLVLQATDAYLADRVTSVDWIGETEGVWLVIDATIGSKFAIATPYATLMAGGLEFTSSNRPQEAALNDTVVAAGLPHSGSFVFELPSELVEGPDGRHVVVRFATTLDPRLDSVIDVTLDLSTLEHQSSAALQEPGMVAP
jgi:hypothetical protein